MVTSTSSSGLYIFLIFGFRKDFMNAAVVAHASVTKVMFEKE
jgi:hypothetical protein